MYQVVKSFKDKDGILYRAGDTFPKEGIKKPSTARLKVLSTAKNKYKVIFIRKIEE